LEYFRVRESSFPGHPTDADRQRTDQPRIAEPWVKNLLAGQGFSLPEDKQFWWNVHLETFLRSARKRGPEIPLEQLVADYLAGLRVEQPPWPDWRVEQVRMALEVPPIGTGQIEELRCLSFLL
jgi:hypothetical protein